MRRCLILALLAALLLPNAAMAERLTMEVLPGLSVDAELPMDVPDALPVLRMSHTPMDADLIGNLLMPSAAREDHADADHYVIFGSGDGDGEYMLIEMDYGRVCYGSEFFDARLRGVLRSGDGMSDQLHYYPEDREVSGFPRQDAVRQAEALIETLRLSVMPDPRVLTIDGDSYNVMLEDLSQADWQAGLPRRYLELLDDAHAGYLILYTPAANGVPMIGADLVELFVSRQGVEYLETGFALDVASADDAKPLLSAAEALTKAAPQMDAQNRDGFRYVYGSYLADDEAPSTIERIRFGYRYDVERKSGNQNRMRLIAVYEYAFQRAMSQDTGNWQTRSFDNFAAISYIYIDAITGEYIETSQG